MEDGDDHSAGSQRTTAPERPGASQHQHPSTLRAPTNPDPDTPQARLASAIPRRPRVSWWLGIVLALAFAAFATPAITADRWLTAAGLGNIEYGKPAPLTIRVAPFMGFDTPEAHIGGAGGIVIARGEIADREQVDNASGVIAAMPRGPLAFGSFFVLAFVFAAIFSHHMRRSTKGRLLRVQIVSLVTIAVLAGGIKLLLLATPASVLVIPVAMLAMVPTIVLDRIVGLATGILAALVVSLLIPFDVYVALLLLVQASVAGLVVAEHPKQRWRAVLAAGGVCTVFTAGTYVLLQYMTKGALPVIGDPLRSPLVAIVIGCAIAIALTVVLIPLYQLLVGEITQGKLIALEDLSHPLLRQIAEKAPGTWQHSLMMANMAEIAANAIGASGRLVRVGAYYHDLGKSLQPKYFIENLELGETSPHDQLPPEVSTDAIFAHVTEGLVTARRSGLHERIVDFMHMHHGNGVLEYFWAKCREQGNPKKLSVENFRYPGHPPQSRETAILAICDAVEAASRTLKKPDAHAIDSLVQRIVYGKLHLGQLDESGLSMADLRRISDSLRETIRHANHGRIEYPWQKAQQGASAGASNEALTQTGPRLDSLDRPARRDTPVTGTPASQVEHAARTQSPPAEGKRRRPTSERIEPPLSNEALASTADLKKRAELAIVETAPAVGTPQRPSAGPPPRPRTESERAVPGHGPAPDVITPSTFSSTPPAEPRKRAATFPPVPATRSPTLPPIAALGGRSAGPPPAVDLENAVTNPPPLRRQPSDPPPNRRITADPPSMLRPPAAPAAPVLIEPRSSRPTTKRPSQPLATLHDPSGDRLFDDTDDASITGERHAVTPALEDAGRTEPSLPKVALPLRAPPSNPEIQLPQADWAKGLADRIDAQLEQADEWGVETPVVAPTKAELRALLGNPDPTRKLSLDEVDRLRLVSDDLPSEPELLVRRPPPQTAEVDPEDIEAAIELAPPARRPPNAIAVAKPKKKKE